MKNYQSFPFFFLLLSQFSAAGPLPDTGQSACFNTSGATDCISDSNYPRQDGSYVSDLAYTKIDSMGNDLDSGTSEWSCTRDNATGLVWEVKTSTSGLRYSSHQFSWFNSDSGLNGGIAGNNEQTSSCNAVLGSNSCNTENYSAWINTQSFCGFSDWRLPTQAELLTLVHAGNLKPTIDTNFFPNTASVPYWSSTTYAMTPSYAWGVHFGYGAAHAESKSAPNAVRLVRGTWMK